MDQHGNRDQVLLLAPPGASTERLCSLVSDVDAEAIVESSATGVLDRLRDVPSAFLLIDIDEADARAGGEIAEIRDAAIAKAIPIVLLGPPHPTTGFLQAIFEHGGVDYLAKPVDDAAVAAKLRGMLESYRLRERAKREAEQFRMIVQGTKDYAIFMLDPQGRVASWNAGAKLLKGYDAEEILGSHLSRFYPPEVVESGWVEHELRMAAAAGRFEDEGWRLRKDGSRFWANVVITALYDENDELRGFAKVTRDLTSRKQAEEAARQLAEETAARRAAETNAALLSEERERLRVTLASIGDGVITTDRHGRVTFMNAIAEGLTGWSHYDARDRVLTEIFEIVNESSREPVDNPALRALQEGTVIGLANHTVLIARDRTERFIDDSAAPIRDARGNVVGSVLVFRDIRERRRAEGQRNARAAATQALAAAQGPAQAIEGVLAAICENMRWNVGMFWHRDETTQLLHCAQGWCDGDPGCEAFVAYSRELEFARGVGLPGRVWSAGEPVWVEDFASENLPRSEPAKNAGMHAAFGCPVKVGGELIGVVEFFSRRIEEPDANLLEMATTVAGALGNFLERRRTEEALRQQTFNAEALLRVGKLLGDENDLQALVQLVTDEATRLCGAQFGAFFYNVVNQAGESYTLYTLSGVPREAFEGFPMPRNTAVFGPTFAGQEVIRLDDVTKDPRYGKSAPYHGMPQGHLPVRSYLAAAVVSRTGEVHGGLFFGHPEPGRFTEQHEQIIKGIAAQAAIAIDNTRLFQAAQRAAERLNLALSAAQLGDWSWDLSTDLVTFSERAASAFGIAPGPVMTWTQLQERLHPEDRERTRAEVERVIAERAQYDIEYRVVRPDGTTVWVGALGRAIYDKDGRATGMYGVVRDISERKSLERSLKDSEARFRSLMEQAPFSIQVLSSNGSTLRVNKSFEELWGLSLDKLADYNILEDPQLEARGVMPLIRAAFEGTPSAIPAIRYDPNESLPQLTTHPDPVRWVAAMAYPIKDEAGVVREVVFVHEDVTASRRAQSALLDSEERLRMALDAGQMGVWDWNVRTGELDWSDSLEPLHGLEPGEFRGTFEAFLELVHPDDRPALSASIREALEQHGSFHTEFRNPRRDGSIHWIAGSGKLFTDENGNPRRMIGVGMDVTERKRAEQNARFLAAASATLAEIVDFDSTLQRVARLAVPSFADWAAVDVLGADGELRRVAVAHVDEAKVQLARDIHLRVPPAKDGSSGAWHILRTGQSDLFPEIRREHLAQVTDPDVFKFIETLGLRSYIGVPLRVRGVVRGALTFVAAESGHTYDQADLEVARELAHRTSVAIENAELYEELRQADRQKDEFLATLAHELRNPLAPIRSGLHVLRLSGRQDANAGLALTMMERQVEHLVRLVDDLLDVSRITRNRLELRMEPLLLADVIRSAVETSQPLVDKSGHTLSISLPPEPVRLRADRVRLAQVFSNLLNNAARYTPRGGSICLDATCEDEVVAVRVSDTGLGIPAESLPTIFEMFAQVDRGHGGPQGGLGIGLTLVKRLVDLHGGSVEATSEGVGKGSEFVVRLPLFDSSIEQHDPVAATASAATVARRILVVDDNADAAHTLEMMLGLMGQDVRVAVDGPEALGLAQQFHPELVLLDIGLPKMSGYEVCRRMRSEAWARDAMIVAVTGWGQEGDRQRSKEAGFDEHLVKPVSTEQLETILGRLATS